MKCISATFNGTGAAVYICCGFIPDKVLVRNVEATNAYWAEWSENWRSAEQIDGCLYGTAAGVTITVQTAGQGIQPYEGGDLMTSTNQTTTTYGEGVYLRMDDKGDYRFGSTNTVNPGDGNGGDNDTWTLDTSANRTGHVDVGFVGTYVGEGSRYQIDGKLYTMEAMTSNGESTDEITLSRAAPSGDLERVTGKYDFKPLALGEVTPAGFKINNTTLNVNDNTLYFEASTYDK